VAKIRYSNAAKADLEQIGDYISETLKSPLAALKTVNKIQNSVDNLEEFPLMGPTLSSIVKVDTDYRFLVSGKYLVFYHADSDSVYIDRILYGRRDYLQILFGALPEDGE
jgi:addiction module RelE/StbE family toxin